MTRQGGLAGADEGARRIVSSPPLTRQGMPDAPETHAAGAPAHEGSAGGESGNRPAVKLSVAVQLAAAIARPLGAAVNTPADTAPLAAADILAIARHPDFAAPLNRAIARMSALETIDIDAMQLRRLGRSAASNLALMLATGDAAIIGQASLLIGAMILHRHFLSQPLKSGREALRGILGDDIYQMATREAPVLHASLAGLDGGSFALDAGVAGSEEEARDIGRRIAATGGMALRLLVDRTEPFLVPLFAIRNPVPPDDGHETRLALPLTDQHAAHIVKLLHRRFPPWSRIVS
ncbi:MAG: hypothetical protein ACOYJQ_00300 [Pseudochelatococcus sp.]|jgi:hypothetical protein|uniref:hypothetical protein n=1 Tax=Pseudochelatococcus sp. TaxID=2020869 RepID=UPI003D8BD711